SLARRRGGRGRPARLLAGALVYSSTKLTSSTTCQDVTLPPSTVTFCSLTQAPLMLRRVSLAFAMPCWTASSKLVSDLTLMVVMRATDMGDSWVGSAIDPTLPRRASGGASVVD